MEHLATISVCRLSLLCATDTALHTLLGAPRAPTALQSLCRVLIFLIYSNLFTSLTHFSYSKKGLILGQRSKELEQKQSESHNFIKVFSLTSHC